MQVGEATYNIELQLTKKYFLSFSYFFHTVKALYKDKHYFFFIFHPKISTSGGFTAQSSDFCDALLKCMISPYKVEFLTYSHETCHLT